MIEFPNLPTLGQTHTTYDADGNPIYWVCTNVTGPVWSKNPVDLVLTDINSEVSSDSVLDVFIYNTSKDDDPSWIDKATTQSWYDEVGKFPTVALIVTEANKISIYDGTKIDTPLWMVFEGASWNSKMVSQTSINNTVMKNGVMASGSDCGNAGLIMVDFIKDSAFAMSNLSSWGGKSRKNISQRNEDDQGYSLGTDPSGYGVLGDNLVNNVAISSDGQMNNTIAVGTDASTTVVHSDYSAVSVTEIETVEDVGITDQLIICRANSVNGYGNLLIGPIPTIDSDSAGWRTYFANTNRSITPWIMGSDQYVTESFKSIILDTDKYAIATDWALNILRKNPNDPVESMPEALIAYITTTFNSGWQPHVIKRAWFANDILLDRGIEDQPLVQTGSLSLDPVAPGAELQAVSGFSASNYLSQVDNGDLAFGTEDFYLACWVKQGISEGTVFINQSAYGAGAILLYALGSSGSYRFYIGSDGQYELPHTFTDVWEQIVVTRKSDTLNMYLNGRLALTQTVSALSDVASNTAYIGVAGAAFANPFAGSLALLRLGAGAPTAEQVDYMYETEKAMFKDDAKCLLEGTSDSLKALAYSEDDNVLTVCSADHITRFNDLIRVSDEATVAISASRSCGDKELIGS